MQKNDCTDAVSSNLLATFLVLLRPWLDVLNRKLTFSRKENLAFAGGSLRFSTEGQLSLTPGQRIGKARRALSPRGVRGHAPPENFEILWSQGRVFLHFEAADNDFQQPKKGNSSSQLNHD